VVNDQSNRDQSWCFLWRPLPQLWNDAQAAANRWPAATAGSHANLTSTTSSRLGQQPPALHRKSGTLTPAQELLEAALAAPEGAEAGVAALAAWLRLAAARKLRWNVNYNVKPREISAAQVCCWLV
jgi:hypothetical protein